MGQLVGVILSLAVLCAVLIWIVGKVRGKQCAKRHLIAYLIYSILLGALTIFGDWLIYLGYPLLVIFYIIHAIVLGILIACGLFKRETLKQRLLAAATMIAVPLLALAPPCYLINYIKEAAKSSISWKTTNLGNGYYISDYKGLYYKENKSDNGGHNVLPGGMIDCAHDNRWIIVKTRAPYGFQRQPQQDTILAAPIDSVTDYWIIDKSINLGSRSRSLYDGHIYYANVTYLESDSVMVRWSKEDESHAISRSVTGPLDSTAFMQEIARLNIPLSFGK